MNYMALPLLAAALFSSGCASIVSGTTKIVEISSATPDSHISIVDASGRKVTSGSSPMAVALPTGSGYFRPQGYKVSISSPGYRTKTVDVLPIFNPWYLGNLFIPVVGTIGGLIVDPSTGAFYGLGPDQIDGELDPGGENVGLLIREHTALKLAMNYPVSRHDYTARQRAKALDCQLLASPEVKNIGSAEETLIYECRDGRQLAVVCRSNAGCV